MRLKARHTALREVNNILGSVHPLRGVEWAHKSNQFMSDQTKKLIDQELNAIMHQLINRELRVWEELLELGTGNDLSN